MNPAEFANIAQAECDFWWYRGMRRILFGMLDPVARRRRIRDVLEAGCGTGYSSLDLERRYGWRMFPTDLAIEGLAYGRGLGACRLVQSDIRSLPYAQGSFDAVVSLDVIVHLEHGQEEHALAEFHRVLKPGGLLIMRVAALEILRSGHSRFIGERQRFTRSRLLCHARNQGFRVLRCTYVNSLLLPVALAKFRLWEPLSRQAPASGVTPVSRWLDRLLSAPLALESAWLAAGFNLPIGQSLVLIGEKPGEGVRL